jgi:3D-(3,5/4)-trihydroxycyclohexane-1,2-dione acylhydrolase (decyclizing)
MATSLLGKGLFDGNPYALDIAGSFASDFSRERFAEADLVIGVGTRLQDFTTGSRALFASPDRRLFQVNVAAFDAHKHGAEAVIGDADVVLAELEARLSGWRAPEPWRARAAAALVAWNNAVEAVTGAPTGNLPPSDAQVIGAVQRATGPDAVVVCAAGGLPGELHKLWRTRRPGGYHVEYGYSCMGYEIAGGLGVKMARPDREVVVMLGDGSYLMLNSEIATSVMLGRKLTITVLDNHGFGCINRLQQATGGAPFNNLLADAAHETLPEIDFAAHAASLGARSEKVAGVAELEAALARARESDRTSVIVVETDPMISTEAGGAWWDVAVPEVSERPAVRAARAAYEAAQRGQRTGD